MAPKVKKPRTSSRNPDLIRGVGKYSRSQMYHKRGLWAIKAKHGGVFPKHDPSPNLRPFKINGVPLRRVHQAYVIATSTKVDISGVNAEKFDDKYFAKVAEEKKKKNEGEFFEAEKEEKIELLVAKKEDQKAVDAALIKSIEVVPDLKDYLAARFSLKAGMKLHELVF
ncbi:Ribosomal protein L6, N-terminal [Dillenia turbinata]|uniref:60S ribosomal protein L6 n=1 Tax=Dillenia turbinata TaxID=194707 RepID=A0AAN8VY69_9MAGN